MPSRNRGHWLVLAVATSLAGCAADRPTGRARSISDTPVKLGVPYRAGGRLWVPADDRGYDAVGYASWYGGAHAGRATANGERFDPRRISAAHPTLPLPSYVEVTALESGRTILTRVNDRGPFVASRIIDLSAGAAHALGIERQGVARVRVRRVQPPEADRAALRAGRAARARPDASRQLLASLNARRDAGSGTGRSMAAGDDRSRRRPSPGNAAVIASREERSGSMAVGGTMSAVAVVTRQNGTARPMPPGEDGAMVREMAAAMSSAVPSGGVGAAPSIAPPLPDAARGDAGVFVAATPAGGSAPASAPPERVATAFDVRIALLDDADRADGLAATLAALGPARAIPAGGGWQVRLGPYVDIASARAALARALRAGYQEARIVRDSAQ